MLGTGPIAAQPIAAGGAILGDATLRASATLAASVTVRAVGGAVLRASATVGMVPAGFITGRATLNARASISVQAIRVRQSIALTIGAGMLEAFGGAVMRSSAQLAGRAAIDVVATSAFADLIANPNRRLVYTIEMDPWLLRPYEDAA